MQRAARPGSASVPPSQSDITTATPLPGSMPSTTVLLAAQQRELPFGVGLDDLDDCNSCAIRESNAHHLLHESHSLPLLWSRFNCSNLTRVYPDARRVKSSNYNPFPYWAVGAQPPQLAMLNESITVRFYAVGRGGPRWAAVGRGDPYICDPSVFTPIRLRF